MGYDRITALSNTFGKLNYTRWLTIAIVATFSVLAIEPAHAQAPSSDTWKSVAIIGGSTVAGAYIGHKVAGPTGTWVGAGLGAATGYAIDRRRRANEYGPYSDNSGYYGNPGPNGNGPYNGGPYSNGPYAGNGGPYGPAPDAGAYPYPPQPYSGNDLARKRIR